MQFLYSGDRGLTGHKERVDIIGTAAQLRALGTMMSELSENTGLKGQSGVVANYPVNLPVARLLLAADDTAPLQIDVPPAGLSLTAGKETFGIIGMSIKNSFKAGDISEYEILITAMDGSKVLTDSRRDLYIRSVKAAPTSAANGDFYGSGF